MYRREGMEDAASAGLALLANTGEAYKLPSFFALGNPLVGNPDLDPETVTSWDVGLAWKHAPALELSATWFDADYRDLIDFDDETFRNVNRQRVKTSGVELAAQWSPAPAWSLRGFGTYTDIDVPADDTVLTGRPQWSAGVVAQWDVARAWQAVLDYRYGGEQWSSTRYTGEQLTAELPDYHRVDAVLHFVPTPRWQWQLALDNLLDEDYETAIGFAAPGRMLHDVSFINASGLVRRIAIRRAGQPPLAFLDRPAWIRAWFPGRDATVLARCRRLNALLEAAS